MTDGMSVCVSNGSNGVVQLCEEVMINFATAQHIGRIARHAALLMFAHPLQIVWIVTASFKASGVPGPKAFALSAEHLITALGLMNENLAIWAWFGVVLQKSERGDGVGVANVQRIITCGHEFPAMRAGVLVAGCTLPCGRHEAVAVGISTAVNELFCVVLVHILCGTLPLQLILSEHQISLDSLKLLNLCLYVLELEVNALDEPVMRDGSLSGREHGLFLSEEDVLLVLSELAYKE